MADRPNEVRLTIAEICAYVIFFAFCLRLGFAQGARPEGHAVGHVVVAIFILILIRHMPYLALAFLGGAFLWWEIRVSHARVVDLGLVVLSIALFVVMRFLWYKLIPLLRRLFRRNPPRDIERDKLQISDLLKPKLSSVIPILIIAWLLYAVKENMWPPAGLPLTYGKDHPRPQRQGVPFGVALSGGGYRAALFHAGVLHVLDQYRVNVQAFSTVSGGSIIGSYYVAGGEPSEFLKAVINKRFDVRLALMRADNFLSVLLAARIPQRDVSLIPWIPRFTRTDVQARMLDRLYLNHATLSDLEAAGSPALMLDATDLRNRALVGFTAQGMILGALRPEKYGDLSLNTAPDSTQHGILPLYANEKVASFNEPLLAADLVAASGAFPVAFRGRPLDATKLYTAGKSRFVLMDGGIVDNQGLLLLRLAHFYANLTPAHLKTLRETYRELATEGDIPDSTTVAALDRWRVCVAVVSDGSAISGSTAPSTMMGEVTGVMDILSDNRAPGTFAPATVSLTPEGRLPFFVLTPSYFIARLDESGFVMDTTRFPFYQKWPRAEPFLALNDSLLGVLIRGMNARWQQRGEELRTALHRSGKSRL